MTSKELVKLIRNDGWYKVGQKGSHAQFKHPLKKGRVTIPMHSGDLAKGTEMSIRKQAGI